LLPAAWASSDRCHDVSRRWCDSFLVLRFANDLLGQRLLRRGSPRSLARRRARNSASAAVTRLIFATSGRPRFAVLRRWARMRRGTRFHGRRGRRPRRGLDNGPTERARAGRGRGLVGKSNLCGNIQTKRCRRVYRLRNRHANFSVRHYEHPHYQQVAPVASLQRRIGWLCSETGDSLYPRHSSDVRDEPARSKLVVGFRAQMIGRS
jgi:hypothetical protein